MAAKKKVIDLSESKIRIAKWMVKENKTKKSICEYLGITYNTKKLEELLSDFDNKLVRTAELKEKAKLKVFTDEEQKFICKEYMGGKAISVLAEEYYVSSPRIKAILLTNNVPIRSRSKHAPAQVDHIKLSIDREYNKKDAVFIASHNCIGEIIEKAASEDILEFLMNPDNDFEEFECDNAIKDSMIRELRGRWVRKFKYDFKENGPKYPNGELVFPKTIIFTADMVTDKIKGINNSIAKYGCSTYHIQRLGEYYRYLGVLPVKDFYPIRDTDMITSIMKKEAAGKDSKDDE